jgi:hypothetical protein
MTVEPTAQPIKRWVKDPNANRPYSVDWSRYLATGDTISAATWTVPAGLTKGIEGHTTTTAWVQLSGGTAGQEYLLVCQVTTTPGGWVDERTVVVEVRKR